MFIELNGASRVLKRGGWGNGTDGVILMEEQKLLSIISFLFGGIYPSGQSKAESEQSSTPETSVLSRSEI